MKTIIVGDQMFVASSTEVGVFELPTMVRVAVLPLRGVTHFAANDKVYACLDSGEVVDASGTRLGVLEGTVTAFAAIDGAVVYGRKQDHLYWVGVMDEEGVRETPTPDVVYALSGEGSRYAVGCDQRVVVYDQGVDVFNLHLKKSAVCMCMKGDTLVIGMAVPDKIPYAACCVVNLANKTVTYPMYGIDRPPDRVIAVACGDGAVAYSTKDRTTVIRDDVFELSLYGNQLFLARDCFVVVSDTNICIQAF